MLRTEAYATTVATQRLSTLAISALCETIKVKAKLVTPEATLEDATQKDGIFASAIMFNGVHYKSV